jgi:hypothetical protein
MPKKIRPMPFLPFYINRSEIARFRLYEPALLRQMPQLAVILQILKFNEHKAMFANVQTLPRTNPNIAHNPNACAMQDQSAEDGRQQYWENFN